MKKSIFHIYEFYVAYRERCTDLLSDKDRPFKIIANTTRYWAADPFIFEKDGETFIFAELFDRIKQKGVIGYCKLSNNEKTTWNVAIEEPFHLSFPYIYEKDNSIFIMPESLDSSTLRVYKAIEFPRKWELITILRKDAEYVDSIFLDNEHQRHLISSNGVGNELYLIDLCNSIDRKIKCGGKMLRNAGAIINEKHLRVSQDCEPEYGAGLIFNKFSFDDNNYKEQEVDRVYPKDIVVENNPIVTCGLHTYNVSENFEVIDLKSYRIDVVSYIPKIIWKAKNLFQRK